MGRAFLIPHFVQQVNDEAPLCCLMDRSSGWQLDSQRGPHLPEDDPINDKSFVFVRGKVNTQYMQCVLQLDILFARGLPSLAVRQSQAYYNLVLKSPNLADVLPGQAATIYQHTIDELDGVVADVDFAAEVDDPEDLQGIVNSCLPVLWVTHVANPLMYIH